MRQPGWDKYETALLVEAYWKIKADRSKKGLIVATLSASLRKRAAFDIDDTFRNENGINMRLGELDYLFSSGSIGLKNTSDLFREMVDMYLNNRSEYEKILSEAKGMVANAPNVQAQFCDWLQEKAPKLRPEAICQLLAIGEDFCKKLKVLTASLFETTDVDVIKKFVKTVTNNKIFRIRNKKQYPAIVDASNRYYSFIRDLPELNRPVQEEKTEQYSSSAISNTNNDIEAENSELDNIGNDEMIVSFNETQDYGYTKPLWFRYKDQKQVPVRTWAKLYVALMKKLVEEYPTVFVADLSLPNGDRIDIAKNNEAYKLRRYSQLTEDLLIEINISARDLVKRIAVSASMVGLSTKDIEIHYVKRAGEKREGKSGDPSSNNDKASEQVTAELVEQVSSLICASADGISKNEICDSFSSFSTHQINLALVACHAVLILKKYYHRDNISDYQEMADILLEVIDKQFSQNGNYTSAQQLYNEARPRLDDFFFYNNAFDSRQEVYDLAVHLFEQERYKDNSFIFMNNMHIWKEEPDYPKDYHGLMIKYAREHGNTFTREDAVAYFEQIGSTTPAATFSNVIFNTGNKSFLQYAENQFVLTEAIHINDYFLASVSTQIENLLEGEDYIATGEIDDYFYTTLPALSSGIFWSALLLEDVLRIYETGFTTIEAGKDNDKKTVPAAIVRKKSHYRSFGDVVWNEVSKSFSLPKEFTASEFREFLLNKGFIRGSEKMWSVHKTVAGDIRFYWTDNNGRVTIN